MGCGQILANKRVRRQSPVGLNEIGPAGRRAYRGFVLFFYYIGLSKTNYRFWGIYFLVSKWLFLNCLLGFVGLVLRFWVLTRFRSLFGSCQAPIGRGSHCLGRKLNLTQPPTIEPYVYACSFVFEDQSGAGDWAGAGGWVSWVAD